MSLCDPIATICLIEKNLFSYKNCSVKVITEGDRMGQTIPVSDNNNSNVQIAHKIDETKIWNLINQLFIR